MYDEKPKKQRNSLELKSIRLTRNEPTKRDLLSDVPPTLRTKEPVPIHSARMLPHQASAVKRHA